jgi:hypothetical protein
MPVQGVYSASKHAVKGFTNALRMELIREKAPVQITLVKPAAVDSPYNKHARNLTGYAVQAPQPVYASHVVADAILHCAAHPIREITVGGGGRIIASFYAALPGLAEPMLARFAPSLMRDRKSAYQPYDDGLYDPTEDGLDEEVHYPMVRQFSALAEVRKHPGITAGALALVGVTALAVILMSQRSGPTRFDRLRAGLDPRGWGRNSWHLRDRASHFTDRAGDLGRHLRDEAGEFGGRARSSAEDLISRLADILPTAKAESATHKAGRYAKRAGSFARDHAREGGSLLALATIVAAIGAAALDARRNDEMPRL